jgi:hypothetical protein
VKRAKLKSLIQKKNEDLFDMQHCIYTSKYNWWMRTYLGLEEDCYKPNKKYEEKKN